MLVVLKVRHEAVMRRTVERSQRTRQKTNRWSWGGALNANTPSAPTGTLTSLLFFYSSWTTVLMSSPPPACCLFALKLFTSLCASVVTADSRPALPPSTSSLSYLQSLSLSPLLLFSLSLSAIVTLPSWSRFCRVGFALSTRPCRTGAHAECLQSLPQIRWNDLSMWIWRFRVSPSQTASSSSTCEAFRSFVLAETYSRPWVASRLLVRLVRT